MVTEISTKQLGIPIPHYKNQPFEFLKARYLVGLTGRKARNLKEFMEILKDAEDTTLFYHIYHPLLESHLVPPEYPNDFSFWFADSLQNTDLAEEIANIEFVESGFEQLKRTLIRKLELHSQDVIAKENVIPGNEFHFLRCNIIVYKTGIFARNLDELIDHIADCSELSLFYHLVTSRVFRGSKMDDFSEWIVQNTKEEDLAERIRRIDPTTYSSVNDIHIDLMQTISKYFGRTASTSTLQNAQQLK
jgi:hypothetical protein